MGRVLSDTLKHDYVIKTIEMFSFLLLINHSVTTGLSFFLSIISAIISKLSIFFVFTYIVLFNIFINILHIIWVFNKILGSLKYFNPVLSALLIKNWFFFSSGSFAYKYILSISSRLFIKFNNSFIGCNCFFLHSLQLWKSLLFLSPLNSHSHLQFLFLHFLLP